MKKVFEQPMIALDSFQAAEAIMDLTYNEWEFMSYPGAES